MLKLTNNKKQECDEGGNVHLFLFLYYGEERIGQLDSGGKEAKDKFNELPVHY